MRRPLPITLASRRGWNRLVDRYFAGRLAEVSVLAPPLWRHPWFCSLRWDETSTSWTVAIRPGWCESPTGDPSPQMRTLARLAPRSPEAEEADPEDRIVARLDDGPRLRIPSTVWRAVGTDAVALRGPGEPLPDEIARRGVLGPVRVRETISGIVLEQDGLQTARNEARLARACELVLEHGRETAHLVPVAVGAAAVLEVDLRPPAPRGPQLALQTQPPDTDQAPPPFFPGLGAIQTDEGVDRIRLATLWLTSPVGTREGADPDGTWRPYVDHRIRRNLAYEVTGPAVRELPPLDLSVPGEALAGGAGANILRTIADDLRSRLVETEALLSSVRTRGRFVVF